MQGVQLPEWEAKRGESFNPQISLPPKLCIIKYKKRSEQTNIFSWNNILLGNHLNWDYFNSPNLRWAHLKLLSKLMKKLDFACFLVIFKKISLT